MFTMSNSSATVPRVRRSNGILVVLLIAGLAAWSCLLRLLHLLDTDHYYLVSPDSYFFHWQAASLLSNQDIPLGLHGGLTYPLAFTSKALSLVLGIPLTDALRLVSMVTPPVLGMLSMIILYALLSRAYSSRVALLSCFAWALATVPVLLSSAGFLDRDYLSVVIVTVGALAFHLTRDWQLRFRGMQIAWVARAAALLAFEGLLYAEWTYIGPLTLLVILVSSWAAEVTIGALRPLYRTLMQTEVDMVDALKDSFRFLLSSLRQSDWPSLGLVLCINFIAAATGPGLAYLYRSAANATTLVNSRTVAELGGLTLNDILVYQGAAVAAAVGSYVAIKNSRKADVFFLAWFLVTAAMGLFVGRLFLFGAPAVCVLSGLGLSHLLGARGTRLSWADFTNALANDSQALLRYAMVAFGIALMLLALPLSLHSGYRVASSDLMSANTDWQAGMRWLRANADQEARIMSHWTFGYFILDMADRRPIVDNGFYFWDSERNHDIAVAYCTSDVSEAAAILEKYRAEYLVFSTVEYYIIPDLTEDALGSAYGDGSSIPLEMRNSLYARSLSGRYLSGEGLRRVYPEDPELRNAPLVVLQLE